MPVPRDLVGTKMDQCQCGRKASVRHCPECGSTRMYGYAKPQFVERAVPGPDGEPMTTYKKVQLYRCQRCNHQYSDSEREFCVAPPIGEALQRQRDQAKAQQVQHLVESGDAPQSLIDMLPHHEPSNEESYREYKRLEAQIRGCYADECYALKLKGETHHLSEAEYIDAMLIQLGKQRVSDPSPKEG